MSKKNFSGGLNSLLGDQPEKPQRGRPKTKSEEESEKEVRSTFIVTEELLEKIKCIAYWDRLLIKDVITTALQDAVAKYEKKNGDIKPIPKK